jgi:hypothetical protein
MNDEDIINVYELIKQKMNANQPLEKNLFDSIEKIDANMISSMSEKELEYQKSLECNKGKYMNWQKYIQNKPKNTFLTMIIDSLTLITLEFEISFNRNTHTIKAKRKG